MSYHHNISKQKLAFTVLLLPDSVSLIVKELYQTVLQYFPHHVVRQMNQVKDPSACKSTVIYCMD